MAFSLTSARDEVMALLKTAWDASSDVATLWAELRYAGVEYGDPPESEAYAVASLNWATGSQASFGNQAKWERVGLLAVQIYGERSQGRSQNDTLAQVVLDALEGSSTAGGVWFRNVSPEDVGNSGEWAVTRVTATVIYEELK